jgi:hypothetical protein
VKINYNQSFTDELELPNPQQHAKRQLLAQVYQVLDKIFDPQREVCPADEVVQYSLDFHIIADHELKQIIQNSYNLGQQTSVSRVLH